MTITAQENALFAAWSGGRTEFNPDGVVDEDAYMASRTRLLFVLKEVIGTGDLRWWLRNICVQNSRMWCNVARWVAAIRILERDPGTVPDWSEYQRMDDATLRRHLSTIVAVNIKKSGGGGTANPSAAWAEAEADKEMIAAQFAIYKPHIVVFCGELVRALVGRHIPGYMNRAWSCAQSGVWHARAGDDELASRSASRNVTGPTRTHRDGAA